MSRWIMTEVSLLICAYQRHSRKSLKLYQCYFISFHSKTQNLTPSIIYRIVKKAFQVLLLPFSVISQWTHTSVEAQSMLQCDAGHLVALCLRPTTFPMFWTFDWEIACTIFKSFAQVDRTLNHCVQCEQSTIGPRTWSGQTIIEIARFKYHCRGDRLRVENRFQFDWSVRPESICDEFGQRSWQSNVQQVVVEFLIPRLNAKHPKESC